MFFICDLIQEKRMSPDFFTLGYIVSISGNVELF